MESRKIRKRFLFTTKKNTEIHPLWLRERVTNVDLLDENNGQRLYEPSEIKKNLKLKVLNKKKFLNVQFNDGVKTEFFIKDLLNEIHKKEEKRDITFWDANLLKKPIFKFKKNLFDCKDGYKILKSFYKYGFVIIKNAPVKKNYLNKFANIIGILRKTNFGTLFNVKSVRKASIIHRMLCQHILTILTENLTGIQLLHK